MPRDPRLIRPRVVTFDCWATLMVEGSPESAPSQRAELLSRRLDVSQDAASDALTRAWRRHQVAWHQRQMFGAREMTEAALETLGARLDAQAVRSLVETMEELALEREVSALDGSADVLAHLADSGVRLALICDTGFSPGRVVRGLLDRVGLLERLEVTIFSNEVGVPKPDGRMFQAALHGLSASAAHAVHVGDMRRSDVAGGRAAGMGTVRLAQHYDDGGEGGGARAMAIDCRAAGCNPTCARPEAHAVARHHRDLVELFGYD